MALSRPALRRWAWVHKWSNLVCTVFMLLPCITGLPLIFHHEIGDLLGTEVEAPALPAGTPRADLDQVVAVAQARAPGKTMQFLSREIDDASFWYVTLGDTPRDDQNQKMVDIAVDGVLHLGRVGNVFGPQHFLDLVAHAAFVLELQAHRWAERQAARTPMRQGAEAALAPLLRAAAQRQHAVDGDGDGHRTTLRAARCGLSACERPGALVRLPSALRASG